MDHYYLWEIASDSANGITNFLIKIDARKIENRSMANCLSLSEDKAYQWWPANELADALWDYTDSHYGLYRLKTDEGTICIFLHENPRLAFVQWFD